MIKIIDGTEKHVDEVKEFASKIGLLEQLNNKLDYLNNYGDGNWCCHIGKDFAPYSFAFEMYKDDQFRFNGGLIFHGSHDNGGDGSAPTFSVNLSPVIGWEVHT